MNVFKVINKDKVLLLSKSLFLTLSTLILHSSHSQSTIYLFTVGIYLLVVNNGNTRKRCEICSKLIMKVVITSFWWLYS